MFNMSNLQICIRTLHSNSPLEEKLASARTIVTSLSPPPPTNDATTTSSQPTSSIPDFLKTHYACQLFDWCFSTLVKRGKPGAAGPNPRLHPQLWAVIAAILNTKKHIHLIPSTHPLPASLLPTLIEVLDKLHTEAVDGENDILLHAATMLEVLSTQHVASFTAVASTEHLVGLAAIALKGWFTQEGEGWSSAALMAVKLLVPLGQAPNQRKVWDAAVPRLLIPLIQCGFPTQQVETNPNNNKELQQQCQLVLNMLIFHDGHIKVLVEACAQLLPSAFEIPTSIPDAPTTVTGTNIHKTYAGQFFTTLQTTLQQSTLPPTTTTTTALNITSNKEAWRCVLNSLPWFVTNFATALQRYKHTIAVQGSVAQQLERDAARRAQQHNTTTTAPSTTVPVSEENAVITTTTTKGGGGIAESADFHFYAVLLNLPLHLLHTNTNNTTSTTNITHTSALLQACAALSTTLSTARIYRVNEDGQGHHRRLLEKLANIAVDLSSSSASSNSNSRYIEGGGVLEASLEVLRAILAVEHRAVQEQLPQLWSLLWKGETRQEQTVAESVACSLLTAFAELRQVDVLLRSLFSALQNAQHAQHAVIVCSSSSEFLNVLGQVAKNLPSGQLPAIIRLLGSGVSSIQTTSNDGDIDMNNDVQQQHRVLLLADIACRCLDSLSVQITIAVAVGEAVSETVERISHPLLTGITALIGNNADTATGNGNGGENSEKEEVVVVYSEAAIAALLAVYTTLCRVHTLCSDMHPQVEALPGQHTHLTASTLASLFSLEGEEDNVTTTSSIKKTSSSNSTTTAAALGVFAPLYRNSADGTADGMGSIGCIALDTFAEHILPGDTTPLTLLESLHPALYIACLQVVVYRVHVLYERWQYIQHSSSSSSHIADIEKKGVVEEITVKELQRLCVVLATSAVNASLELSAALRNNEGDIGVEAINAATTTTTVISALSDATKEDANKLIIAATIHSMHIIQSNITYNNNSSGSGGVEVTDSSSTTTTVLQQLVEVGLTQPGVIALTSQPCFMEWRVLSGEVAGVACNLLYKLARQVCGEGEGAASPSSSKKSSKKHKRDSTSSIQSADDGSSSSAILEQLQRLSVGKSIKPKSWNAIEALAEELQNRAQSSSVGKKEKKSGSSSKKRKAAEDQEGKLVAPTEIEQLVVILESLHQIQLMYLPVEDRNKLIHAVLACALSCITNITTTTTTATAATSKAFLKLITISLRIVQKLSAITSSTSGVGGNNEENKGGVGLQSMCLPTTLTTLVTAATVHCIHNSTGSSNTSEGSSSLSLGVLSGIVDSCSSIIASLAYELITSTTTVDDGSSSTAAASSLTQSISKALLLSSTSTDISTDNTMVVAVEKWLAAAMTHGCLSACRSALTTSQQQQLDTSSGISSIYSPVVAPLSINTAVVTTLVEQIESSLPQLSISSSSLSLSSALVVLLEEAEVELQDLSYVAAAASDIIHIRCSNHTAVDALKQKSDIVARSLGDLRVSIQCNLHTGCSTTGGSTKSDTTTGAMKERFVRHLEACCVLAGHTKPTTTDVHFGHLFSIVLYLLARCDGSSSGSSVLAASRPTLPFLARFPAANTTTVNHNSGGGGSERCMLLHALQSLLHNANAQHIAHVLLFTETLLKQLSTTTSSNLLSCSSALALPVTETVLMALEVCSSGGVVRTVKHHAERLTAALLQFLTLSSGTGGRTTTNTTSITSSSTISVGEIYMQYMKVTNSMENTTSTTSSTEYSSVLVSWLPDVTIPTTTTSKTIVAAQATVLRALESLTARPRQFTLTVQQICSIVQSIACIWTDTTPPPPSIDSSSSSSVQQTKHMSNMGILYLNSCGLLSAVLRHREESLSRAFPVIGSALRALLSCLVVVEATYKVHGDGSSEGDWSVSAAAALSSVFQQIATIKEASKYCPLFLSDYIILAASPPTSTWHHLLGPTLSSYLTNTLCLHLTDSLSTSSTTTSGSAGSNVLVGGALRREVASALRYGACAMYGCCSVAEIQYLYVCLRQRGGSGGGWRGALAGLKSDHDKMYKYSGKV